MTKALTLTQPWASAVAQGLKRVETRSWTTGYRGPLLIHAAKGHPDRELEADLKARWRLAIEPLPLGAIVARVRLVDVRRTDDALLTDSLSELELSLGDYSPGRFGWILEDVELADPAIPWTGALGLWEGPTLEAFRR